eukprot:gnl/Trimastix_PCT/581.p1 GENE.gnl/Trimastix_PCT/581~~gnl/Trimastix_PCT/581.p1  ORF type:complete len:443 (+),score=107.78 gnl/Trimastix_PCT/581:810-2138(+)
MMMSSPSLHVVIVPIFSTGAQDSEGKSTDLVVPFIDRIREHPLSQGSLTFSTARLDTIPADEPSGTPQLVVAFPMTGGTEAETLRLLAQYPNDPIVMLSRPIANSFPACLETLAQLGNMGKRAFLYQTHLPSFPAAFLEACTLSRTHLHMRAARIGLLGEPSAWLVATPDLAAVPALMKRWGPEYAQLPLGRVIQAYTSLSAEELAEASLIAHRMQARAEEVSEPDETEMVKAARFYLATKKVIQAACLHGFTIQCFELLSALRTTGCLAVSMLNDEGVPAGCEGDLAPILTMMLVRCATGQASFMANLLSVEILDDARAKLAVAHCTIPLCMTQRFTLRSHFESGKHVAIQGRLEDGAYTLVRIGGPQFDQIAAVDVTLHASDSPSEVCCRTQCEITAPRAFAEKWIERPLGNHIILAKGHFARLLVQYATHFAQAQPMEY